MGQYVTGDHSYACTTERCSDVHSSSDTEQAFQDEPQVQEEWVACMRDEV